MKKKYILLISFFIAFNAYSQCLFTTQVVPQSGCDTTCNSFLNISANGTNGPHYLFVDGTFHSMFTTFGNAGPFCPGFYNLFITDSAGCNYADSVNIVPTPGLNIFVNSQDPSCSTCTDGSASTNVTGGDPPYTYQWSNGANTQFISGLVSGTYCVTVTDNIGCSAISCFVLNSSGCNFITQTMTQSFCDTTCNSIVTYISNGGFGPHHLFLNGVYQTTFTTAGTIGNLCPGAPYNVLITDSAGCNFVDSIFINPPIPMMGAIATQPPSCSTCNDGYAVTTVTGGTPPYTYAWSSGHTGPAIQGLSAGIYCVYISDANGCYITLCDTVGLQNGYSLIIGIVYLDLDSNGIKNTLDPGLSNIQVEANPGGISGFTSTSGVYFISVPNGTYDISVVPPGNWLQTSLPAMYNVIANNNINFNNDFGLLPDTAIPSATILITAGIPRCNWNSNYTLTYKNTGLMIAEGEIIFNKDPLVNIISSIPAPTSINGNEYKWSFSSLYPYVQQNIYINVTMPAAGNILNSSAIINLHDNSSNIIFSDTIYKTQTVTCAYDPNDKQMLPEGITSQNIVPLNTEADYTIRFQNTGNDTAFVVIIKDTLSPLFDLGTFEIIAASHEMYAQMDPGGILTFTFENILLPDSNVNEPASHGFVRYRIQPLQPVTDPTVITNTAHIIFDQNPAIVTNTTLTTFSDNLLSVAEINGAGIVKAYPNPFSNEVMIHFEKDINAKAELFDYLGRVIENYAIFNTSSFVIARNDLKSGLYLLKITTEDSSTTLKLMVK